MKLYTGNIAWHAEILQNRRELPYLVMLHGFMGSGRVFHPLTERLSRFCNPVTVDIIGHGRSEGIADPDRYQPSLLIRDLESVLRRLRLTPLFLYGYSMGGRLALQYSVSRTAAVSAYAVHPDGLILESATYGIDHASDRKKRVRTDDLRASELEQDFTGFLERWNKQPLFTGTKVPPDDLQDRRQKQDEVHGSRSHRHEQEHMDVPGRKHDQGYGSRLNHYLDIMQNQNPQRLAACLRGFSSGKMISVFKDLTSLHIPVLLLSGENDIKFTSIHRKMEAELPDPVCKTIPGAAHRVHLDEPDRLLNEIEHFINRQKP